MTTIGVFGASGFVGSTLVQRLLAENKHAVRPFIHNPGSAWLLARHGDLKLRSVDLLNAAAVGQAVKECTHVVNCSRGSKEVLLQGLKNLLHACELGGVRRFVHISSTVVYGEVAPGHEDEEAPLNVQRGTYAWLKLRQDELVKRACARGLSSVIVCPPSITGPYSIFMVQLLKAIREGWLSLTNGGRTPCNLIDVHNLAKAIHLGLFCDRAEGVRLFVTDDSPTTWGDLVEALSPLTDRESPLPAVTETEARRIASRADQRASLRRTMRCFFAGEVREVLRRDPLMQQVYAGLLSGIQRLPRRLRQTVLVRLRAPPGHRNSRPAMPAYAAHLHRIQLRRARHSCARAKAVLGYTPDYSFAESMEGFHTWYRRMLGWESEDWPLIRQL